MVDRGDFEGLFELAQHELQYVIEEFAAYGVRVRSGLEVRRAENPAFFYDRVSGHIYIFMPDLSTFTGMLYVLFLSSLFGCASNQELAEIFRLWIPYLIAHEVAHSVRDAYGLMGSDAWLEEQVAIQFAAAIIKRRVPPAEKADAVARLARLLEELKRRIGNKISGPEASYNLLDAFRRNGKLGRWSIDDLQVIQHAFSITPEAMLNSSGELAEEFLQQRQDAIAAFNQDYASNLHQYAYYQLSCLYYELISHESSYVETLVQLYLGRKIDLLPLIASEAVPGEAAIRACYQAFCLTVKLSETSSRYFYKRYRSLLLERLRALLQGEGLPSGAVPQETIRVLESWGEEDADLLILMEQGVPASMRPLLPQRIATSGDTPDILNIAANLPDQTDQRIWRHIFHQAADEAAAATLLRLQTLEHTRILRSLPTEALLELSHLLIRIRLRSGETLIWEGETGNDLYLLSIGELAVYNEDRCIDFVAPGDMVGEIAFFTREPATATVRAMIPSECFVLKAYDFHRMGLRYPTMLLQMSKLLASQLLNLRAQANKTESTELEARLVKENRSDQ